MENKTSTNHENGNDANRLLADVWQTSDRPFRDYPIGTKAQAQGGGYWIKNERAWYINRELEKANATTARKPVDENLHF